MKKFLDGLVLVEKILAGLGLLVMVFITAGNVIARKLFNTSWSFTEELACALFIFVTMIGAAIAARNGSHIGLSFVTDLLPRSFHKPLTVLSLLVAVAFTVVLFITGIQMVRSEYISGMHSAALHLPEWIYGLSIPFGAVLLFLHFAENNIRALMQKEEIK